MEKTEIKETDEGTKDTQEVSPIETPEAKECLEPTEKILVDNMKILSTSEKLDAFKELEEQCADAEGRDPRAFESGKLEGKGELFRSSLEKVEVDKERIAEWKKMDETRLSDLKKRVFSIAESRLNPGASVSFGRTCSQKCIDCDVKSGDCRWG